MHRYQRAIYIQENLYRKITYDRKTTLCISGVSLNLKKRRKARHYLFTSNPMRNAASANEARRLPLLVSPST